MTLNLWKIERKENNKRPSLSNKENISTTMKKKKYEESCVHKFNHAWKKEFPWVEFDEAKNEMFCRVCRKYPSVCDRSSRFFLGIDGSPWTGFRRESLISHNSSRCHYFCFERAKNETRPEQAPLVRMNRKFDKESQERLEKLFNTVHFVAKETHPNKIFKFVHSSGEKWLKHWPTLQKSYSMQGFHFRDSIIDHERNKIQNDVCDSSYSL